MAAELGNSVDILMRHYRELVRRHDAERFWRLIPRGPRMPCQYGLNATSEGAGGASSNTPAS